jgi:hypothetical protein
MTPERLSEIDEALDAFGVPRPGLARAVELSREAKMSLAEVDAALESLAGRFETRVPEGALARSGSWERARASRDAGSGRVEVDATIDPIHLPAVLSDRPPAEKVTIPAETSEPNDVSEARPSIEIMVDAADTSLRDSLCGDGTDVHGVAGESQAPIGSSALELELEGEPAPSIEQASAKFSVPKDSVQPSPKSVIPPPADLDAELASILAEELEPAAPAASDEGDEVEGEATALFSADMFGAAEEPSLAELISPPRPTDGDSDSLEIDIDDEVLVYEATDAPPTDTRPPPPPGPSAPPPAKPGFLGRLLNRKP